jgi:hypothetical protein
MRFRSLPLALLLASGCGGPDPVDFKIRFSLSTDPAANCASDSCGDFAMGCGATLGIRVVAADDLASAAEADGSIMPLDGDCKYVPPVTDAAPTLCDVDSVAPSIQLQGVRTGMAMVQVAIGPPPANPEDPPVCPESMFGFNLLGFPLEAPDQPAFGGSAYFDVGSRDQVDVALGCPDPSLVNNPDCLPKRQSVTVKLRDMETDGLIRTDIGSLLTVSVGEPGVDNTTDPPTQEFLAGDTTNADLELTSSPALWKAEGVDVFDKFACMLVNLATITTVSCTKDPQPDPTDGHFDLFGLYLPDEHDDQPTVLPRRDAIGQLLTAALDAGIINFPFPSTGMVIGRVIDKAGVGLAGVRVTGSPVSSVGYFTEDADGNLIGVDETGGAVTRANGYFLSLDAPFGTQWSAEQTVDLRREAGTYHAGLIANKVSIVLIRMGDPP